MRTSEAVVELFPRGWGPGCNDPARGGVKGDEREDIRAAWSLSVVRDQARQWFAIKPDLLWIFELEPGGHSSWAMMVGVQPTDGDKSLPSHADECAVYMDYSMLGSRVPDEAVDSRFDDHQSYFTMVFDHRHDLINHGEREGAFRFMAEDLQAYADRIHTRESLLAAVADGMFDKGFVDRALAPGG
jgi:hypothetical protein